MHDFTLRVKQARRIRAREGTQAGRDASEHESTTQTGVWMQECACVFEYGCKRVGVGV